MRLGLGSTNQAEAFIGLRRFQEASMQRRRQFGWPMASTTHSIDVQLHNICDEAGESVRISVEVVVVAIP